MLARKRSQKNINEHTPSRVGLLHHKSDKDMRKCKIKEHFVIPVSFLRNNFWWLKSEHDIIKPNV